MLARDANNLFWLNRYLQRVEITARLIRAHTNLLMDLPDADPAVSWSTLLSITGGNEEFAKLETDSNENSICQFLISDSGNAGSMANNLEAIKTILRLSRNCMSPDLYELIKILCSYAENFSEQTQDTSVRQGMLEKIEYQSLTINGAISSTMSRDAGYLFLRAGHHLERADMALRILDVQSTSLLLIDYKSELPPNDSILWRYVLNTFSAFQIYMKQVRKPVAGPDVLSFLLKDQFFPFAMKYCLTELAHCIRLIGPGHDESSYKTNGKTKGFIPELEEIIATIDQTDIAVIAKDKQQLHEFIDQIRSAIAQIYSDIESRYFPVKTT